MINLKRALSFGLFSTFMFGVNVGYGAPGNIKERPLFLGFSVQPNIYFVVDDSGSMAWDVTKTTDANKYYPEGNYTFTYQYCRRKKDGSWRYYTKDQVANCSGSYDLETRTNYVYLYDGSWRTIDSTPDKLGLDRLVYDPDALAAAYPLHVDKDGYSAYELLEWCVGYNATAYDPNIEYTPWVGYLDSSVGISSSFGYIPWNDDGDGVFEIGECSNDNNDRVFYSTMTSDEKQNFRNWYTYYRKRQNVAKKAISEVVADSEARMGLAAINDGQLYSVKDMKDASNKASLLNKVFDVEASGSTPLRQALNTAGQYFEGSSSPIQSEDDGGSCQQNYTILMTDGYWNGSSPNVGNIDGTSSNSLVRASDKDSYSSTLADVAMKYYATDLDTILDNEVPTIDGVDENDAQHMVTFTVAFGINGDVAPNDTTPGRETDANGMPLNPDQSFAWPKPSSNTDSTIDDVRHAAWNGRGLYLSAKNPQSLIDALAASIDEIESRTGTASALAFNSTSYKNNAHFFYAQFNSGSWAGELISQELSADLEAGDVIWSASDKLDNRNSEREIITYDSSAGKGVPFRVSSLPSEITSDLTSLYSSKYSAYYSSSSSFLNDAVDYLRGDRSNEGAAAGKFRDRSTALGDIINSTPVFVQGAMSNWPSFIEPGYLSYLRSMSSRDPMIFVGANDGMLHSFDADTGEELFSYVPASLASTESDRGLHYLVDQAYNHRYYVDGTPEIADAYINSTWKTVLVGNLGAGGKSIFALDVTNPSSYSESDASQIVLWETSLAGNGLGLTYPQPKIVKMNDGRWVVVVANGYHNTVDGKAKIFILDVKDGSLIKTFDTGTGGLTSGNCSDACNGMSAASISDIDGNGTADFIYAGDLKGNIWAINVASSKPGEWVFDSQVTYEDGIPQSYSGNDIDPVFKTEGGRPITTKVIAVNNPVKTSIDTWPNQLLFFGSGQFIAEGDHETTDIEHFYGVMHANSQYELSISGNGSLFAERVIKSESVSVDGETTNVRFIEPKNEDEATFDYGSSTGQKMGWYIRLPAAGERVVHHPILFTDFLLFNTLIPESDPCAFGATGYAMAVSLLFGSNPDAAVFDLGIDENIAGYQLDSPPGGMTVLGNKGIGQSTFDKPEFIKSNIFGEYPDRMSWEELK
ncbi:pilus assembly protein [Litoribacillus peritrichatus]|uniref:PilC/PilY family type IV pilus protein n=1 Tax=Litoribacillus peritrichatus TaxID=718191 RepID=A0ABP7NB73_9GAMM